MPRHTANDFHPEVMKLFDKYVHGIIDRRSFLNDAARYTAAGVSATALLEMLNPKFAEAQQIKPDDARLVAKYAEYVSPDGYGNMKGYLVMPAKMTGKLPGVVVVHENRGLNPHIKDVTRRLALEGFVAFGADFLAPRGGTPADEDKAREMIGTLPPSRR